MVNPGGSDRREREVVEQGRREWVEQWRCSRLSQKEFCRRHGLPMSSFSRWKLALMAEQQGADETLSSPALPAAPQWLAVRVKSTVPAPAVPWQEAAGAQFEVVLRGERRVRLGRQFDAEGLRRLVAVLESVPC